MKRDSVTLCFDTRVGDWWGGIIAVYISRKWVENIQAYLSKPWHDGLKFVSFSASDPWVTELNLDEINPAILGLAVPLLADGHGPVREDEAWVYLGADSVFDDWNSEFKWRYSEVEVWPGYPTVIIDPLTGKKSLAAPTAESANLYYTWKEKHSMEGASRFIGTLADLLFLFEDERVKSGQHVAGLKNKLMKMDDELPNDLQ